MASERRPIWFRHVGGLKYEPVSWQGGVFLLIFFLVLFAGVAIALWLDRWLGYWTAPVIFAWAAFMLLGQYAFVARHSGARRGA